MRGGFGSDLFTASDLRSTPATTLETWFLSFFPSRDRVGTEQAIQRFEFPLTPACLDTSSLVSRNLRVVKLQSTCIGLTLAIVVKKK